MRGGEMSNHDASGMRPACGNGAEGMHAVDAISCHVTGRYGTERKNHQDPAENRSVPDRSTPVDNRHPSMHEGWEEQFLSMERAGRSASEIAYAFGVSTRSVSRWRSAMRTTKMLPPTPRPKSDRDRVSALLDDGCSFSEAARTVGVSTATIRRWFPHRSAWTPTHSGEYAAMVRLAHVA